MSFTFIKKVLCSKAMSSRYFKSVYYTFIRTRDKNFLHKPNDKNINGIGANEIL